MTRLLTALVALLPALGMTAQGRADTLLSANLTHNQETTQGTFTRSDGTTPRPLSFGTASFVLNDAGTALTFTATITNIDVTGTQTADTFDNLVAAHIHAGPTAVLGMNAPVVWGFFGTPDNDIAPDDLVVTPFATGVGGTFRSKWDLSEGNGVNTLTSQLPNILSGRSYINFHTVQFGGGEIRGQIIPEPSTLALSGLGMAAVLVLLRRRRSAAGPSAS